MAHSFREFLFKGTRGSCVKFVGEAQTPLTFTPLHSSANCGLLELTLDFVIGKLSGEGASNAVTQSNEALSPSQSLSP